MAKSCTVTFGDQLVEVPLNPEDPVTLADIRRAFGHPDSGVVIREEIGAAPRPIATLPSEPILVAEEGVTLTFIVTDSEDGIDGKRSVQDEEDAAVVRELLAMGAAAALRQSNSNHLPYIPPSQMSDVGCIVYPLGSYCPFEAQPLSTAEYLFSPIVSDKDQLQPQQRLALLPVLSEITPATREDPFGLREALAELAITEK